MIWGQEFLLDRAQHLQSDSVQLYDIDKDPEERNNIEHLNDEARCQFSFTSYIQFIISIFVGSHIIEEAIARVKEGVCSSKCCEKWVL